MSDQYGSRQLADLTSCVQCDAERHGGGRGQRGLGKRWQSDSVSASLLPIAIAGLSHYTLIAAAAVASVVVVPVAAVAVWR